MSGAGFEKKWVCVFCASAAGASPVYLEAASELGRRIAERGHGLVYGGATVGAMGAVADAALGAGGAVVGVIPDVIREREIDHKGLTELHVVRTMHERKAIMAERADAFVALPGGLGTLEEIFEVWSWRQLGFHAKPVGFLDAGGFWTPLLGALRDITDSGFLPESTLDDLAVAPDLPGLLEALQERLRSIPQPAHGENLR